MSKKQNIKVGDSCWLLNSIYDTQGTKEITEFVVVSETRQSLVIRDTGIDYSWRDLKVLKRANHETSHGRNEVGRLVFWEENLARRHVWAFANCYKIAEEVKKASDTELAAVAKLIGYPIPSEDSDEPVFAPGSVDPAD